MMDGRALVPRPLPPGWEGSDVAHAHVVEGLSHELLKGGDYYHSYATQKQQVAHTSYVLRAFLCS